APAVGSPDVTPDVQVLAVSDLDRMEGVDVLRQSVTDPFAFRLEGAEHAVPDDQDAAVVLVEVLLLGAVVDPVVARRVEDELDWSRQLANGLRVKQELVEKTPGER